MERREERISKLKDRTTETSQPGQQKTQAANKGEGSPGSPRASQRSRCDTGVSGGQRERGWGTIFSNNG